jgi:predicted kinase
MSQNYDRLLDNQDAVEHFLSNVLDFDYSSLNRIIYKIVTAELQLVNFNIHSQTLNNTKLRDRAFANDDKRWMLRKDIIQELFELPRPQNDDDITLGHAGGGALPRTAVQTNRQAYIIIGLPASGKSGISNRVADHCGGIILDPDFAKRKLPEYPNYDSGATIVHEESSKIVFGFSENPNGLKSVFELSLSDGYNLVIPKIGQKPQAIIQLANVLKKAGYDVHLMGISLLKREATIRAIYRFHETQRYVPLGLIFDGYGNDPCLTYHVLKNKANALFTSFGAISTNVKRGESPVSIDLTGNNPARLYPFVENILI